MGDVTSFSKAKNDGRYNYCTSLSLSVYRLEIFSKLDAFLIDSFLYRKGKSTCVFSKENTKDGV